METRFTWDPEKAKRNLQKHGVSFETALEVFADPNAIAGDNYFAEGEQRLYIVGMSRDVALLLVVFVDRSDEQVEEIRIISARKANALEEQIYAEG